MSDDQRAVRLSTGAVSSPCWACRPVAARWRSPAARPTGSRSWCPIWCSRRTRSPASPPGTRAPAPSAPPGAACTCGPARAARSSSRAIPSTRSTRASSAPAARRRSRGCTTPGGSRRPMARGADGSFTEITWDDAIARLAAKLTEAGRQGRGASAARGAGPSPISWPSGPRRWAGGWSATRPFDHEPMRAANRQVFGLDQLPAHDFGRAKYIVSFGADFLDTWRSPIENQRGFARSHGFGEGDVAKFVYAAPAPGPDRTQRRRVAADHAGLGDGPRAGDGQRARRASGATPHGLASALSAYTPADGRAGDRPAGRADRAARARVRGGAARASRWPAASARSTRRAPSCAPRSTSSTSSPATSARRCGSAPISPAADGYAALAELAQAMDGGAGRRRCWCTTPIRCTPCPRPAGSPGDSRRWRSRCRPRSTWTRPPPSATCCCRSITRSSGGTTLAPRAGVYGA